MNIKSFFSVLMIGIMGMSACNSNEGDAARRVAPSVMQSAPAEYDIGMENKVQVREGHDGNVPPVTSSPATGNEGTSQTSERKIIKTASIRAEIRKYASWNEEVLKLVQNAGGYIVNSYGQKVEENVMRGSLTIRVPQVKFDVLLKGIRTTAKNVENETLSGQDVTEEFADLEARLDNKRKTEMR
ncbi:MAG TPA: DUF4349 domain-containing protein, partial [Patescibacteria group bacterium]|nr:DUF4349 domain-containing protein [Patescibacteria group bacterium]